MKMPGRPCLWCTLKTTEEDKPKLSFCLFICLIIGGGLIWSSPFVKNAKLLFRGLTVVEQYSFPKTTFIKIRIAYFICRVKRFTKKENLYEKI